MADEMVNQTRASCSCSHVLQSQRPSLFLCAFGWRYWRFSLNVCGLVLALTVLITVLNSVWLRGLFPVYRQIWQWSISSCLCAGLSVFACVCAPDSVYRQCLCVWVHVQMRERVFCGSLSSSGDVTVLFPFGRQQGRPVMSLKQLILHADR